MLTKDKGIVLQLIRYNDSKYILKLYTLHHGLVSADVRVSSKQGAKIKPGHLLPLNLLQIELSYKQHRDIHGIREVSCYHLYKNLHTNPGKIAIVHFINEVLLKTLKEHHGNEALYTFIEESIVWFDESHENPNVFHHFFLLQLLKYMGIDPEVNHSPTNKFFDCREGKFSELELAYPLGLNENQSKLFYAALKQEPLIQNLNKTQRNELLDCILAYYQIHIPGFNNLKSLEVLRTLNT